MLKFLKRDLMGSSYNEKSMGPRIDPWGTLHCKGTLEEETGPNLQKNSCQIEDRWERNQ